MNFRFPSIIVSPAVIAVFTLASFSILDAQSDDSAEPPFRGTVWIDSSIITPDDPTAFLGLSYLGTGQRRMFDRRLERGWTRMEAHLFLAKFDDGLEIEVQVNPEFTQAEAEIEAKKYLPAVGRIPHVLRQDVETIWIHRGNQPFGGGNNNILIHTDSNAYTGRFLEETLVHEASHTSLDGKYARAEKWRAAQKADNRFISTYAKENPVREDIAESFLPYLIIRHRPNRIDSKTKDTIEQTMPHRIQFFDALKLDLHPMIEQGRPRNYEWILEDGERIYGRMKSLSADEIELNIQEEIHKFPLTRLTSRSLELAKKLHAEPSVENSK